MAQTKGVSFVNAKAFAEERRAGAWAETLERLSPADRDALESIIAVGWYDLALYARMIRVLDSVLGRGDLALLSELGRYGAERDLTTIQRLFFRLASPAYAIEKIAEYWRRFHDTGTWNVARVGEHHVTGSLDDWGVVDAALCAELVAYMARVIELVGGKNATMLHPRCRARGAKRCEFELSWES